MKGREEEGRVVLPVPLLQDSFAAFGEVIAVPDEEGAGGDSLVINAGTCRRFDALARVDVDGVPGVSVFRAVAREFPFDVRLLERHPLGSQAFVPMGAARFVVVAAPDAGGMPNWDEVRAFEGAAGQGVNFFRHVWHHPLLAVGQGGDFLVVDRLAERGEDGGVNLEECAAPDEVVIRIALGEAGRAG